MSDTLALCLARPCFAIHERCGLWLCENCLTHAHYIAASALQSLKFHTPIRFKGLQTPEVPDMPSLGAHSESVLLEFLGMDADEVARLRDKQAI